ncbi:MAG: DUF4270 domain-containing protein [Parabacteroides sp.]|nr:DUF4270 domain-containing protein [Parabacteroides sp.]
MKSKFLLFGLLMLALAGCDDDMNYVGTTIQPPGDKITAYVDSFQLTARTVYIDSLYAKTSQALLGHFTDPLFGSMKADFLCSFYCADNFRFKGTPVGGQIDSIDFKVAYEYGWVGDSLAPQIARLYKLNQPLTEDYYITKLDPLKYYSPSDLLATKSFTAYDKTVPDSVRTETDSSGNPVYVDNITFELPREFGQNIYETTLSQPEKFNNTETFSQLLPGFYVTTDQGSGCILRVSASAMYIYYHYEEVLQSKIDGSDSIVVQRTAETFNVTPEVIQLSHVENDVDELIEKSKEDNHRLSYLKSPAGVYTEITFPVKAIKDQIGTGRTITNMPFSLKFLPMDKWDYALVPSEYVLLLPADSLQSFFKEGRLSNNITSFLSDSYIQTSGSTYNPTYTNTYTYNFNNISTFLEHQLQTAPDEDIRMLIVPVERVMTQVGSGYYQQSVLSKLNNYFQPSGVKLLTDQQALKIQVRSAEYADGKQ